MAEDKKIKSEDKKEAKKAEAVKEVKENIKVEKIADETAKISSVRNEKSDKEEAENLFMNSSGLEELPDDIKKKLEKKKEERKTGKGRKKKKKTIKNVAVGRAFISASYNNTIISLTDLNGNVISWASAGMAGFKGPKKSTPYAAQIITRIAVEKAREAGLQEVSVYVKGVGSGRESAVRALNANGLNVSYIKDITPVPHNGCRKRKARRV